jgi:methylmalonyl-CoA mutase N-terminal domain/subunit
VVRGIDQGWFQRQIAQSAARQQREVEQGRRTIVGVNDFVVDENQNWATNLPSGLSSRS